LYILYEKLRYYCKWLVWKPFPLLKPSPFYLNAFYEKLHQINDKLLEMKNNTSTSKTTPLKISQKQSYCSSPATSSNPSMFPPPVAVHTPPSILRRIQSSLPHDEHLLWGSFFLFISNFYLNYNNSVERDYSFASTILSPLFISSSYISPALNSSSFSSNLPKSSNSVKNNNNSFINDFSSKFNEFLSSVGKSSSMFIFLVWCYLTFFTILLCFYFSFIYNFFA
jgi:hypothetical protein